MKKRIIALSLSFFALGAMNFFYGQDLPEYANWYNGKNGMNTEKAYSALKKKESKTVVVAVIDSGIDIEHQDLKGKIWTNEKEIPNNGIDDDNNGYIDDIHGWSFLGSAAGNQKYARLEKARMYAGLKKRFEGAEASSVAATEKADYDLYKKLDKEINAELSENKQAQEQYSQLREVLPTLKSKIAEDIGKENFTLQDVEKWKPKNPQMEGMRELAKYIASGELSEESIQEALDHFDASINYQLNADYNDREFIGDNPDDFNDIHYGTNDVEGPDALHGTHVGGIIGAVRGNKLGGDGVAENVKLMSVRAVPDGDEADKDIALAIRYAVDNGASVINMSFGKAYSPHQKEVYEALAYADSKDVLLVHAAGNDAADVDATPNYPTSSYSFQKEPLGRYLTIGASTRVAKMQLPAVFSNYGQTKVDVFAPGFEIYNSVPQSEYKNLQGTSMAAPMVAGVAALLKSYFPSLTMLEIKDAILSSAKSFKGTKQNRPGTMELVDFGTLSVTGGVVDVPAAVKKCMELEKSKTKK